MAKQDRGFASMDPEMQRRIASKGGKRAHKLGRAHEWTVEEARAAGRKGGLASHKLQKRQQADADLVDRSTADQQAAIDDDGNNGGSER